MALLQLSLKPDHEDLNLLLNLIDLLSFCARQTCPLADEYSQRIFSCETLIE